MLDGFSRRSLPLGSGTLGVARGEVISGQLDDACLDDEPTEFNQVSGALATLDLPGAHVTASQSRLPAIAGRPVALECCDGCAEMPEQFAGTGFRKTSPHA